MSVKCFDGGAHLFERCTCDDRSCRTWLCAACGHIIDRKQKGTEQFSSAPALIFHINSVRDRFGTNGVPR